jgi:hypothetical protein
MILLTGKNSNATFAQEKPFFHVPMFTYKFVAAFAGTA